MSINEFNSLVIEKKKSLEYFYWIVQYCLNECNRLCMWTFCLRMGIEFQQFMEMHLAKEIKKSESFFLCFCHWMSSHKSRIFDWYTNKVTLTRMAYDWVSSYFYFILTFTSVSNDRCFKHRHVFFLSRLLVYEWITLRARHEVSYHHTDLSLFRSVLFLRPNNKPNEAYNEIGYRIEFECTRERERETTEKFRNA